MSIAHAPVTLVVSDPGRKMPWKNTSVTATQRKVQPMNDTLRRISQYDGARSFDSRAVTMSRNAAADLYWLPLGAGGHCVRMSGRVFEAFCSRMQRREMGDLYHSALGVQIDSVDYVIEMAPVWNERTKERGVVAEGPVGHHHAGRFRLFRYEIRCWRGGHIPDVDQAVESPVRLSSDPACAARILGLVPKVPTLVWGRDDSRVGDMWNSNSLISWLLTRSEIDTTEIHPPKGGRAPGWQAGLAVAEREIDHGSAAAGVRQQHPRA